MAVKRKSSKGSSSDYKKRRTANDSADITAFLKATLSLVQELRDGPRLLKTQFLKVPSKKAYPDYYERIQAPISLHEIKQKVDGLEYESADQFADDFKLMADNAAEFNLKESVIAQDAFKMFNFVNDQALQFSQNEESGSKNTEKETPKIRLKFGGKKDADSDKQTSHTRKIKFKKEVKDEENVQPIENNGTSKDSTADKEDDSHRDDFLKVPVTSEMKHKLMHIVEELMSYYINSDNISEVFLEEPSRKLYPDYYEIITSPMSLTTLKKNLNNRKTHKYPLVGDFVNDALLICANAQTYNEETSLIYEFAALLVDYFVKLFDELTIAEGFEPCDLKGKLKNIKKSVTNIAASRSASLAPTSVEATPQPAGDSIVTYNDNLKKKTRTQKIKFDSKDESSTENENKTDTEINDEVSMTEDNADYTNNSDVSQLLAGENTSELSPTDQPEERGQDEQQQITSFQDLPVKGLAQLRSSLKKKESTQSKPLVSSVSILSSRPKAFYNSQRVQQSHGNANEVLAKALFQNWFEYVFDVKKIHGELTNYALNLPLSNSSASKGAITIYVTLNPELSGKPLGNSFFVNNEQIKPTPHSTYTDNDAVLTSRYDLKLSLGLNHLRVVANVYSEDNSTIISTEDVNYWVTVS